MTSSHATKVDYSPDARPDKIVVGGPPPAAVVDQKVVDDLLGLLARAVQQLHTYPPTSPMCVSAIDACQRALAALDGRDVLAFRVTPSDLVVDERPTGSGTSVEQELARRLHAASVAEVTIDRTVSARELTRLCQELLRTAEGPQAQAGATFEARLAERGVDRVTVRMAYRPEVLDVGAPPPHALGAVARERARREEQARTGSVNYLYPPDKGWVRLDPASPLETVSLVDLALLVDEPMVLAAMLLRLTDDEPEGDGPAAALEQRYSDVAMLFSALDPRLARPLFARLSRAVLELDPDRRQALLRRTILPGLLDGRVDGAVLRDFPDVELADSLCLLLDLETAAPELLTTALARLDLPAERHAAMVPLLESRLEARDARCPADARAESTLARHARDLLRVDAGPGKSFAEFSAFDLSIDEATRAALDRVVTGVGEADPVADRLGCLWSLVRLEPNPEVVERYVDQGLAALRAFDPVGRADELADWLGRLRDLADRLCDSRPDVSAAIGAGLERFCTRAVAGRIADLHAGEEGRAAAGRLVTAIGPAIVVPLADLMGGGRAAPPEEAARARAAADLVCTHAADLAPGILPLLGDGRAFVRRTLVRALGAAGAGYEQAIAAQIGAGDEATDREALRGLARIGTAEAADLVGAEVDRQRASAAAAEETLWRLPRAESGRLLLDLFARRNFAVRHPQAAARLLDRAAQAGVVATLAPALRDIARLRFRFWSPALARVARRAHALLRS